MDSDDQAASKAPESGVKKNLLKTRRKQKKKNLIGELSFVQPHVDTFYMGLNDNWQSAYNPMQAKSIRVESPKTDQLVKNWV